MDDIKIKVIDSDKLINAINEGSYEVNLSAVMALGAVMTDTKKQESCEYCHEDSDKCIIPIEKNGYAFINFGMNGRCLEFHTEGWRGKAKINYCPMCGRKL